MKKLTQQEYDNRYQSLNSGIGDTPCIVAADTDCTDLDVIERNTLFGNNCIFADGLKVGAGNTPKNPVQFGTGCEFGEDTHFGRGTYIGSRAFFGKNAMFESGCKVGKDCMFVTEPICLRGQLARVSGIKVHAGAPSPSKVRVFLKKVEFAQDRLTLMLADYVRHHAMYAKDEIVSLSSGEKGWVFDRSFNEVSGGIMYHLNKVNQRKELSNKPLRFGAIEEAKLRRV